MSVDDPLLMNFQDIGPPVAGGIVGKAGSIPNYAGIKFKSTYELFGKSTPTKLQNVEGDSAIKSTNKSHHNEGIMAFSPGGVWNSQSVDQGNEKLT
jgi:hypothetical protein